MFSRAKEFDSSLLLFISLLFKRTGVSRSAVVVSKKSSGFIPWRTAARVGKNR